MEHINVEIRSSYFRNRIIDTKGREDFFPVHLTQLLKEHVLQWHSGQEDFNINRKDGTTFVVVSHDISISDVADRVIHLRDGKISKGEDAREPSRKKVKAG